MKFSTLQLKCRKCHLGVGCGKNAECGVRSADTQNAESQNADTQNADSQNAESQNADTQNADYPKND